MKNAQLPILIENEIQVAQYAKDIRNEMTTSANAWKRIAEIFSAAQEQFGSARILDMIVEDAHTK
jgi:capsid portal protein